MRPVKNTLLACLFAQSAAFAQTDSVNLKDLTVTSNRIQSTISRNAISATIVTRKDIGALPGSTPADWLGTVNGVDIRQRGPVGVQADMGIRGGSFDQSLVLFNGMKLSDPQTGHHLFNLPITPEAIEQIEVIKTAASRMYGINALTGAVNFVTRVPEKNMFYLGGFGGDFGLYGLQTGVALHHNKVGSHLSFAQAHSNGYLPNTDFNTAQLFGQTTITNKKSVIDLTGGYTDRSFGATGFYVPNSQEYESIQTAFGGAQYRLQLNALTLKAQAYYRYNQDRYIYIRSNPGFFRNRHFSHVTGAELHLAYKWYLGETGAGVDYRREELNSNNLGTRDRTIYGVFAEHRFMLFNNKLHITPGIYLNSYADNQTAAFPGIDANYSLSKKWSLFASTSKGMRLPTFTDLYYNGPSNIGNPVLKAEEAVSSEAGIRFFTPAIQLSVAGFQRVSTNLIDWAKKDGQTKWQPLNVNHVTFKGIETNISYSFKYAIVQQISLGHNYIDANINQTENYISRYSLSNMRHQVVGQIRLNWLKNLSHTVSVRHVNRVGMADYTLVDSKLMYQLGPVRLYTEVSNILNTNYVEAGYVNMPGRWFRVGADFKLNFKNFK